MVGARLQRKYLYAFSAVSPHDGVLDSLVLPWVNAETMSLFLAEVAQRHANEFVLMVMDQAGWHIAGELVVPPNMRLMLLPPYSPELNPDEMANADIKQAVTKLAPARTKLQLAKATAKHLRSVQRQPERIRKYFEHATVRYAA